jgi:SnoaL-like protein
MSAGAMADGALGQRLALLEDRQAILELGSAFAAAASGGWSTRVTDPEAVAALFVPDGVWDGELDGQARGHEQIRAIFGRSAGDGRLAFHLMANPVIALSDDRASGRWNVVSYGGQPGRGEIRGGIYHAELLRTPAGWRFARLRHEPVFSAELDALTFAAVDPAAFTRDGSPPRSRIAASDRRSSPRPPGGTER